MTRKPSAAAAARKLRALAGLLGYPEGETGRLEEALTHKSFANEAGPEAPFNERLEFLGDAVVGLLVARSLMLVHPTAPEGTLSRLRAGLVNARSLADLARELGLGELLRVGRGEELTGGRDKDSLLADAYEALLGAVFLDLGLEAVSGLLDRQLADRLGADGGPADRDFKTAVQELVQGRLQTTPSYNLVEATGPEHAKEFVVELVVEGVARAIGRGRSKKLAEREAARLAWPILEEALAELTPRAGGAGAPGSAGTGSPSPRFPPGGS